MSTENNGVGKLTIRQLLSQLHIGQLWALLGICVGLLIAVFGLGKVGLLNSEVEKAKSERERYNLETQKAKSESELQNIQSKQKVLAAKARFLDLYLQYTLASQHYAQNQTPENQQQLDVRRKMFVKQINMWWRGQAESDAGDIPYTFVKRVDLDVYVSKVVFTDQTSFPIPREIKEAALAEYYK